MTGLSLTSMPKVRTWIAFDKDLNIIERPQVGFIDADYRNYIVLGILVHIDKINITRALDVGKNTITESYCG